MTSDSSVCSQVRGSLRSAPGKEEGRQAHRCRGGRPQQEEVQEDREEVQGEAKGGKGEIKDNIEVRTSPENKLSQML